MDLCPDCAFCSLKREQCQNIKILNRVHCKTGGFIPYINPQISAQYQAADKVLSMLCVLLASEEKPGLGGGKGEDEAHVSLSHPIADQLSRDLRVLWHGRFQRAEVGVLVQPDSHPWL